MTMHPALPAFLITLGLATTPASATAGVPMPRAFVWPVSGYIGATHYYRSGEYHHGSADLWTQYGTPVLASRDGKAYPYFVDEPGKTHGSWGVIVRHGEGYSTSCGHFLGASPLARGQIVKAGQRIGYSGRTGYASIPHVHFSIARYGVPLTIPGIQFGQWVTAGRPTPAIIGNINTVLPPVSAAFASYTVRVTDASLDVRSSPSPEAAVVGVLTGGTVVTVRNAAAGFFKIGKERWIPWSGTTPAMFDIFSIRTIRRTALRKGPGTGYESSGSLDADAVTTAFEIRDGWYKILYGLPTHYRWLPAANAVRTEVFRTKVSVQRSYVRTGPGWSHTAVGSISIGRGGDLQRVYRTKNGWYQILYNNKVAWIPGWETAGLR